MQGCIGKTMHAEKVEDKVAIQDVSGVLMPLLTDHESMFCRILLER